MRYSQKQILGQGNDIFITKDGHTMFFEDVVAELNRLAYLEKLVAKIGGSVKLRELAKANKKGIKDELVA